MCGDHLVLDAVRGFCLNRNWSLWLAMRVPCPNRCRCRLCSHPGYFGKVGMRHFHKTTQKYHCPSVNLDKLWTLVSEQTREAYASNPEKVCVCPWQNAVLAAVSSRPCASQPRSLA
jgi:hypothetical protein